MKTALCALTGLGNSVLSAMCDAGKPPVAVFTRKESGEFPHYECEPIEELARKLGVPVYHEALTAEFCLLQKLDLILCATYHKLLKKDVLDSVTSTWNLHPSLLPKYRGASPFFWIIRNGETHSGVTLHELVPEPDAGDILGQVAFPLGEKESQGSLRKLCADQSGPLIVEFLEKLEVGSIEKKPQDESKATYFPRFSTEHGKEDSSLTEIERDQLHRALSPWPRIS